MNPRSRTYTVLRHGFTLIEMLLALALGAFVITAAGRTAVLTLQTERAVQTAVTLQTKTDHLFATIAADLNARTDAAVTFALDANHRPTIEVTCLARHVGNGVRLPRLPSAVVYGLTRSATVPESFRLERRLRNETRTDGRTDDQPITTVADELTSFDVDVFHRDRWEPLTAELVARLRHPKGFRIAWQFAGSDAPTIRTFLINRPYDVKERDDGPR